MKRTVSLIFVYLMCFVIAIACFAEEFKNPPITDNAKILTDSELSSLSEKLENIRQQYDFEVAIVTEAEMTSADAMSSADDIYDYNGYGAGANDDGIMLYICTGTREYHLTTHADGMRVFNKNGITYLKKNIQPHLENNNFYHAMDTFINLSDELLTMAKNGEPFNKKQYSTTYFLIVIGCALLIPLLIAYIMMNAQLQKMNTAVEDDYAANYIKPGSKKLTVSRDIFLYSHITKTEKPKDNSASHKSSSGRTHGGSGGSF